MYQRFPTILELYYDVDWNTLSDDSSSTTSYMFVLGGDIVVDMLNTIG